MSELTEARQAIRDVFADFPVEVQVAVGPGDSTEHQLNVRVLVGPHTDENEELLDVLLDDNSAGAFGPTLKATGRFYLKKHAGYQIYGEDRTLGTELYVNF